MSMNGPLVSCEISFTMYRHPLQYHRYHKQGPRQVQGQLMHCLAALSVL